MNITPRTVGLVALAALLPATAFVVLKPSLVAVVTLVNVLIIAGSLALALSPTEEGDAHEENGGRAGANGV